MDRDQLKRWLDDGLSLPQIGALVNRDPSMVGDWVQKYGLVANGRQKYAPRGGLTWAQLEPLVNQGLTLQEIADRLQRSTWTVRHWMKKHGLKTWGIAGIGLSFAKLTAGIARVEAECRRRGLTEFVKRPDGEWRCFAVPARERDQLAASRQGEADRESRRMFARCADMGATRLRCSSTISTRRGRSSRSADEETCLRRTPSRGT